MNKLHNVRVFEWVAAIIMLLIGVHLLLVPEAIVQGRFHPLLDVATGKTMTYFCLFVAILRIVAMRFTGTFIFGRFQTCAMVRALCSGLAGLFWMQMGLALFINSQLTNTAPSIGIPVYCGLTGGEFFITMRAAYDVYTRR